MKSEYCNVLGMSFTNFISTPTIESFRRRDVVNINTPFLCQILFFQWDIQHPRDISKALIRVVQYLSLKDFPTDNGVLWWFAPHISAGSDLSIFFSSICAFSVLSACGTTAYLE